jgi:hypothetical protein
MAALIRDCVSSPEAVPVRKVVEPRVVTWLVGVVVAVVVVISNPEDPGPNEETPAPEGAGGARATAAA